jgi:citrate synthase
MSATLTPVSTMTETDTLEILDNRTGRSYTVPIADGTIRAQDLRQVRVDDDDFGMMSYDPAFMNTASCRSAITYIDGDKGILRYRGYPIEQLAEQATFLEVAYLLRHGELPTQKQYDTWVHDITFHTYVHENIKRFLEASGTTRTRCRCWPACRGTFGILPGSRSDERADVSIIRFCQLPTLAAFCYRHSKGLPFVSRQCLTYARTLSMIARMASRNTGGAAF